MKIDTTEKHIQKWLDRIIEQGEYMEAEEIFFLMVQARHLVEDNINHNSYRITKFYSD